MRLLSYDAIKQKYGLDVDKSTFWRWTKLNKWPKPRRVAGRNGYLENECDAAFAAMIGEQVAA
jgi:hypothetical protein